MLERIAGTYHLGRHVGRGMFAALAELGLARLTPPRSSEDAASRLSAALRAVANAHDIHVHTTGELPREPALVVANHVSYLDPLAILSVVPAVPLAKAEVADWPVIGGVARALGVTFVDRRTPASRLRALRRINEVLGGGTSVLMFPEGTTTDGSRVLPFHHAGFGIASRLGRPVVPIAIRYADRRLAWTGDAAFLPHYLATARRSHCRVHLAIGRALYPRTGEPPQRFAARTRAAIMRLLGVNDATTSRHVSPSRSDTFLPAANG